jgi:hypothetical protein
MGHHRYRARLPDTAPWQRVVGHVAEGAPVEEVAAATTEAATVGLDRARGDVGVRQTVYLLSQMALAARDEDFAAALHRAGVHVAGAPGVFELSEALSEAVEAHVRAAHKPSDVGEMARLAAIEAVGAQLVDRTRSLFDVTPAEVHAAARNLSTPAGFRDLYHDFFARFAGRFLAYHLSRELSFHVGGNGRFADPDSHNAFLGDLDHHCRQAALIVRTYAHDWYSKHNFLGGITPQKAARFADHCLTKLRDELLVRGGRDG